MIRQSGVGTNHRSLRLPVAAVAFGRRICFGGENHIGQRGIIPGAEFLNHLVDVIIRCPEPAQDGAAKLQARLECLMHDTDRTSFLERPSVTVVARTKI